MLNHQKLLYMPAIRYHISDIRSDIQQLDILPDIQNLDIRPYRTSDATVIHSFRAHFFLSIWVLTEG